MKKLYRHFVFSIISKLKGKWFCLAYNLMMSLNGSGTRCSFVEGLYLIEDSGDTLYFVRPVRYRYYSEGVRHRLEDLFSQYVSNNVAIRKGDVVLDCGANIGEFSKYCQERGAILYSFEPDPLEFCALSRNLADRGVNFPLALWFEEAELAFELRNESGDSSVAVEEVHGASINVRAVRLDSIPEIRNLSRIRLFKLEAEGFELEVLRGATEILEKIEFIAADLGPERGSNNEPSLPDVVNFLTGRGFVVEYFLPGRSILLFRNAILYNKKIAEDVCPVAF